MDNCYAIDSSQLSDYLFSLSSPLVYIVLGVIGSRRGNENWSNETTLYTAAVLHPYCGQDGYTGAGRLHYLAGEYDKALVYFDHAITIRRNVNIEEYRALCFMNSNRIEDAIAPLRYTVNFTGRQAINVRRLFQCYVHLDRIEDALALAAKFPSVFSEGSQIYNQLQTIRARPFNN